MKKVAVVVFLLVVLIVSGCEGGIPGRRKEPVVGYRRGSQGIVINFLPNHPRPRTYDSEPFEALIEIRNRGAQEVGYGGDSIYLSGFDIGIITGISTYGKPIPAGLGGVTQYNLEGGYDTIDFRGEIYPLKMKNIDRYPATILASVCYGYRTVASENICIDPNPYATTVERTVCVPGPVGYGTQGAPIAVSSVDVEPTPRISRFRISIDNVGGGTVFKPGIDYLMKCNPYHMRGLEFNEVDYVRLSKVEVAGKVITLGCKPVDNEWNVKLINGHATVFCELGGLGSGPAYTTPLTIELDYGYRSTISTQVEIIQTPS